MNHSQPIEAKPSLDNDLVMSPCACKVVIADMEAREIVHDDDPWLRRDHGRYYYGSSPFSGVVVHRNETEVFEMISVLDGWQDGWHLRWYPGSSLRHAHFYAAGYKQGEQWTWWPAGQ